MKRFSNTCILALILLFSFSKTNAQSGIIGNPIKIGNIEVAQYDFPNRMKWDDANRTCLNLGEGWRLPTKDELNTLYNNKNQIGNLQDPYLAYWSSTEINNNIAWYGVMKDGFTRSTEKFYESGVRAVRTVTNNSTVSLRNAELKQKQLSPTKAQVKPKILSADVTSTKGSASQASYDDAQYFNETEHVYIDGFNECESPKYKNGFAKIGKLGKPGQKVSTYFLYGYIDESKRIILKPEYYRVNDFSDGLCRVCMEFSNGEFKSGFVNTSGKLVIPYKYGCHNDLNFSEGLCAVYVPNGELYGFIDKTGKLVIPFSYDEVGYEGFENGRARVSNNSWESTLYIDKKGKIVSQTGENELVTLLNGSKNSTTTKNKKKTTSIDDELASNLTSNLLSSFIKSASGTLEDKYRISKNTSGSSSTNSSSSNTASKHTFKVTVTWNNPNCGSCPFPRPSAQNGSVDYFYERSGSYNVKPKCPICGKTQYNTISGFTDNIGTSNQGSKVVTISCN
jgi:hypothetical protein